MNDQKEWLKSFEEKFDRKPTKEEFLAAKKNNFLLEENENSVEAETLLSESLMTEKVKEAEVAAVEEIADSREVESEIQEVSDFSPKSIEERWLAYFEEVKGRKPEAQEILRAKETDFSMSELEAESVKDTEYLQVEKAPEEIWKEAFIEKFGRPPELEEYSKAKNNDFSLENPEIVEEKSKETGKKKKKKAKKANLEIQKPKKSKKLPIIISSVIAFLIIAGLLIFGFIYYSKENQLVRLKEAVSSTSAVKLAKVVEVDDAKFEVNDKNLKPFVDYLNANPSYASSLSKAVEKDTAKEKDSDVYVQKSGRNFLIFPRYVLKMNLVYPSIDVVRKDTKVSFNGKDLGKTSKDNEILKPGTFVPGTYDLEGKLTLEGQALESKLPIDLTRFENSNFSQDFKLEFKFTTPTVRCSSFPDAEVWIDNKQVGKLDNGILKLPEQAYKEGMEIYLKKTFPSTTLESNHVELKEGKQDIALDFKIYSGNISDYKTIINNFLNQYYKTASGLTENPNLINFLEDGASTSDYVDYIGNHFAAIKKQNAAYDSASYSEQKSKNLYEFDGYYYKYNQDAAISLIDISNNELVFNVNFSEIQYWDMYSPATNGSTNADGYQNINFTGCQIIIDSDQAQSLLYSSSDYNSSTGYIKIRSFGESSGGTVVEDPNINWSSLY